MTLVCDPPPSAGAGVHLWLIRAAHQLRRAGVSPEEATATLSGLMPRPPTPHNEVQTAVSRAYSARLEDAPRRPRWPRPEQSHPAPPSELDGLDWLHALWERSPVRWDWDGGANEVARMLFGAGELVCIASAQNRFATLPMSDALDFSRVQFVVPSPMRSLTGKTQDGRDSARCLDNVGPRRFLVVEFDGLPIQQQARIIVEHLEQRNVVPTIVAHSGGKSLHAWYWVEGAPEDRLRALFAGFVRLGADPATWTPCQLVRMPGGLRDNGERQHIIFFDHRLVPYPGEFVKVFNR